MRAYISIRASISYVDHEREREREMVIFVDVASSSFDGVDSLLLSLYSSLPTLVSIWDEIEAGGLLLAS